VRLGRHEPHPLVETELGDERTRPCELAFAVGTARAADDQQRRVRMAERSQATHCEPHAFEGLDAADEQQHGSAGESELGARLVAVGGRKDRVVDTGRHDLDAIGISTVERRELAALVVGRRENEIGAAHRFLLDARA
jgi:hypothetical protein